MEKTTTPTTDGSPYKDKSDRKRRRWKRKMKKARRILEGGLEEVGRDREALKGYLRFRAHFRNYSRRNTLLIRAQRPTARFCKGYRQWQEVGRQVKRGEKGLMIYVPLLRKPTEEEIEEEERDPDERFLYGWTVGYVFDYEQTKAVSEDALRYQSPIPELDAEGGAAVYRQLRAVARAEGLTVREEVLAKEGYYAARKQCIGVRRGMPAASKAATLAHELAHAIAHGPGASKEKPASRAARELEAEGAAYLACYALGLDTSRASLPYLKHYDGSGGETITKRLECIDELAWRIVEAVEEEG